ncbi:hypothetical protein GKC29_18385 [Micromonospora sp. WMMC415]|uniref:hypothetical protein n=1 Tax=Micromonospora sp. WMMC415 TaxID=2675222 RepID=UPI0012B4757C|nr:hypothetical protein [Micromonospora sp. WMMC415]QGN48604.1 hypothetical protein GKC29_18385 [Micromonospora sp. WMMC415]
MNQSPNAQPPAAPGPDNETHRAVAHQIVTRRYVERRIAELPTGPEAADARLRGLLAIFDDITAKGHPEPLTLLAAVLGIPVGTLVTHLRAAGRPWGENR